MRISAGLKEPRNLIWEPWTMAIAWPNKSIGHLYSRWSHDNRKSMGLKISYLSLQQVDLALTLFAANLGFAELNPFMKDLLAAPLQLAMIKVVIPLLLALLVPGKFLIPGIALLAVIIGWNIKELLPLWL